MKKFDLKKIKECWIQNKNLLKKFLVFDSFGNVSQRLNENYFTIKPSGIDLDKISYQDFPIININIAITKYRKFFLSLNLEKVSLNLLIIKQDKNKNGINSALM